MTFDEAVIRHFGFLKDEFGFEYRTTHPIGGGYPHFEKRGVGIDFFSGKGEIEILLCALVDTSVLRPGLAKSFSLQALAMRDDPDAFRGAPDCGDDAYLAFCAKVMKKHCLPVLGCDLKPLEELSKLGKGSL